MIWLDIFPGCGFIDQGVHAKFASEHQEIDKLPGAMISAPGKSCYGTKKFN
jgi:hypothetical protein